MSEAKRTGVLRPEATGESRKVGSVELFFDLVYVFTIIQLSHYLLAHQTWQGALQATVLFLAVWWGWNYTAWAMNWLDPDHGAVRGLLTVLMLAALAMAVAIPDAFADRAGLFVGGYLFLQMVRSAFMVHAFRGRTMARNYAQLLAWSAIAGVVWGIGLAAPEELRLPIWALAVLADYAAPWFGFALPGVPPTKMSTWPLAEDHLAERNRLVFIIALGESILILGFVLSETTLTTLVVVAAVVGFAQIVLLWWLYFDYRLGNAEHELDDNVDPAAMARAAYAYAHALMVAGAIVVAVGIELVTVHPLDDATTPVVLAVVGGPVLYLLGNIAFNAARRGRLPRSRVIVAAFLAVVMLIVLLGLRVPALPLSVGVLVVLAGLAIATGGTDGTGVLGRIRR